MRQWDIIDFAFPHPIGLHPAVVLTPDEPASNQDIPRVNVLIVTTVRADYRAGRYDVMLNGADGLDHLSRVRVLPIIDIPKLAAGRRRGHIKRHATKGAGQENQGSLSVGLVRRRQRSCADKCAPKCNFGTGMGVRDISLLCVIRCYWIILGLGGNRRCRGGRANWLR